MGTVMYAPMSYGGRKNSRALSLWNAHAINAKLAIAKASGQTHVTVAFASTRGVWPLRILVDSEVLYASGVALTLRTPEGVMIHYTVKR
jgi:hypothetical protein